MVTVSDKIALVVKWKANQAWYIDFDDFRLHLVPSGLCPQGHGIDGCIRANEVGRFDWKRWRGTEKDSGQPN
jgi:hypothetical protein